MKKLKEIEIENILFIDIETAPQWQYFINAPENVQKEWIYKFKFRDDCPPLKLYKKGLGNSADSYVDNKESYYDFFSRLWDEKAGLFAEFSRIGCIVLGFVSEGTLRVKSYADESEAMILKDFSSDLKQTSALMNGATFCGHYIKGFDIPFITKRLLINRQPLPNLLDTYGLKPWEFGYIDTWEIWKFGIGTSATLPSMAMAFGLPTPKDDIDGSQVCAAFHNGETDRIVEYCKKDVVTVFNVFKCLRGEAPFDRVDIIFTN